MEEPQQQQKLFIHIPQGCYGKITPETPSGVAGFITRGLATCTFLVATNKLKNHIFACHIDYATNIEDGILGLPAWIDEISKVNSEKNEYINIEIHYQKREAESECLHFHSAKIKRVLKQKGFVSNNEETQKNRTEIIYNNEGNKITIVEVQHSKIQENTYGLVIRGKPSKLMQKAFKISKNISYLRGNNFEYSYNTLFWTDEQDLGEYNDQIKLIKSPDGIHKIFVQNQSLKLCGKLSFKDCDMKDRLFFPPICCFNGTKIDLGILKTYTEGKKKNIQSLLQKQYKDYIDQYYNLYESINIKHIKFFKLPSKNTDECEEYVEEYCVSLTKEFIKKMAKSHKQNNLPIEDDKETLLLPNVFISSSSEEYKNDTADSILEEEIVQPIEESDEIEEKTKYSDIEEEITFSGVM